MRGWVGIVAIACAACGRIGFDSTSDGGGGDAGVRGPTAQRAYLKATPVGVDDAFAFAVAMSGDGRTLAFGAFSDNSAATGVNGDPLAPGASNSGAAYVFERIGESWQQTTYLKASNTQIDDRFGGRIAISSDGSTLAVGAISEDGASGGIDGNQASNGALDSGAVYVFARSGSTWVQQAYVKAPVPGAGDEFGFALALSADGSTLGVGAPYRDMGATDAGVGYVYARSGTTWAFQDSLTLASPGTGDELGGAVALSADGDVLAIGAAGENSAGAVHVYTRTGAIWSAQPTLTAATTATGDRFGHSVALSADGATLAVGADDASAAGVGESGAAYVFERAATTWSERATVLAATPGPGDGFGWRVVLSADGSVLAVGAYEEDSSARGVDGDARDDSAEDSGAAWTFARSGAAWTPQAYIKASNTAAVDYFGTSLAVSATGALLLVGAPTEDSGGAEADDSARDSGAAYLFE